MKNRPISELFKHEGTLYIHCASPAVKAMLARDLTEQGFRFRDGASPEQREIDPLMRIHRDYTIGFCGFACQVQYNIGQPDQLECCRKNSERGAMRVDYARFISGDKKYVLRRKKEAV